MGRGGGAHGGGGHSGGRSFGGRSGGGFGGGMGPGGPGFGGPHRRWGGPIFPAGGFGWRSYGRNGNGCFTTIVVILVIIFLMRFFSGTAQQATTITVSQTERTPVTGTVTSANWYVDEMNFIGHDTDLTNGLKYFYSKTGIQPYVMILDYDSSLWNDGKWSETTAEKYLAQVYSNTFSDNGHLIFAYFACENDSEDMDGVFYFYYGSAAYSIMDKEAETIFWSYFDMNYNDLDQSIAAFIGQTFHETADNIMHVSSGTDNTLLKFTAVFSVICIIVIIAAVIIFKRITKKEREFY